MHQRATAARGALTAMIGAGMAVVALFLLLTHASAAQRADTLPYRDARVPVDDRVHDLLGRMTLEEKFWQLFMIPGDLDDPARDYAHGVFGLQISSKPGSTGSAARADAERINAIQRYFIEETRLGIPIIAFDEAVHGLTRDGATVFPQAIALAATFDPALVSRVAAAIADETGSRGIRQVLSPVVNLADDVRWGRVEETYGEDPYLASEMARAFVSAFERVGIVATPKHLVANVGDGGRDSYPIGRSERSLRERDFPPFQAAIAAGARSVMTAYNSVDGLPATQNPWLLTDTLKRAWGFTGFVISDAAATGGATVLHMTEPDTPTAAMHAWNAGLDVVFQSSYPQYRPYWEALRRGLVSERVIDDAVARVLWVKFELGLFERPYVDASEAERTNGRAEHLALAREAARASIVLLKNDRGTLPLSHTLRSIAVIGADAVEARLGGYSGPGVATISILDGIREALGPAVEVGYAPGPGRTDTAFAVIPAEALSPAGGDAAGHGLRGEYFDNIRLEGEPRSVRTDARVDFRWTFNPPVREVPRDWYSVRWTGVITVPAGRPRRLAVEGNDGYRLYLDGALAIDNWTKRSYGTRVTETALEPGTRHDVRLEYFEPTGPARVRLMWDADETPGSAAIDEAAALARRSDVAIVVAGVEEGEFRDRAFLSLPGRQEEAIEAVAATGTPVVVVIIGGSAVTMARWLDRADAVVDAWYPGEQGGRAVADVIVGDANPAGRLPITFPIAEGQLPLRYDHKPTGRGDDYVDLTGQPLFPFGFGLSYTTFEYGQLRIEPAAIGPSDTATVRFTVKNTGARAGDEVAELYLRDALASVARPVMALRAFERVRLAPGETREVAFALGPADLGLLGQDLTWTVEPGTFVVMIGRSSKDIRLREELVVR